MYLAQPFIGSPTIYNGTPTQGLADATPLVTDLDFSLEIKPAIGAVLVIQFALLVSGPPIRTRGRSDTLAA